MKPGALALFAHLTSVPTAPFYEAAVAKKARSWIAKFLGKRVSVRTIPGGIIVRYRGAKTLPALAWAAHLDHPAFSIQRNSASGATARLEGGLPPHLLAGCAVEAFPANPKDNSPMALGVIGPRPQKDGESWSIRWTLPPPAGKTPAFAVLCLPACRIKMGWLESRSVDDLLGCAVSLEALRRLVNARARVNVTVLLNRAEEVGFIGALDMIRCGELREHDSYLSIESSRELPGSRPGHGPTIRLGDKACVFDANLVDLLDESAKRLRRHGTKIQRLRLTGGTCEATAYQAFGLEAAGIAVPLVNYHNGWGAARVAPERVRISDVEGAVRILVESARLFPAKTLRGTIRNRLAKNHALRHTALGAK